MADKSSKLFIKNMVCQRCILTVENILKEYSIPFSKVSLGEVDIQKKLNNEEIKVIQSSL